MKSKLFSICFLIAVSVLKIYPQEFKFGLIAGIDISYPKRTNPNLTPRSYYNHMITYNFNGYVAYKSKGFWGFSLEPGYIRKGGNKSSYTSFSSGISWPQFSNDFTIPYHLDYFQVPVLFDVYVTKKIFVSLGHEFAWLVDATKEYTNGETVSLSEYNKDLELSGLIGLNYNIIKNLDVGLRYSRGLSNTIDSEDLTEYNQYLQLLLRFKF